MSDRERKKTSGENIPWWVKSIVLIGGTGVFFWKVIQTPVNLQFDFPSFLALLLAVFSVGLAAMFYFKATDSSNAFYDNTYKFTRDIADLLVRIESGFGEKLRHLDEAYKGMQDRFDQLPSRLQVKDVKKELKEEEEELQKIIEEKEKLIEDLVSKTQLREEEKKKFLSELKGKEEALQEASHELHFLKRRLSLAEHSRVRELDQLPLDLDERSLDLNLREFLRGPLVSMMDPEYTSSRPMSMIKHRFDRVKEKMPEEIIIRMKNEGLTDLDGDLTLKGARLLQRYAREQS